MTPPTGVPPPFVHIVYGIAASANGVVAQPTTAV
jgi:hypothetical protein